MPSPYFSGGNPVSFGPPPGLAAILAQRDDANAKAADNIGNLAGGIGGGVVGAFQGAADPGVFGEGTSTASGAGQGFLRNFSNATSGGGSGGGSSFANMIQGGGGAPGGMNVKQLQAAGKTADAFRAQMKTSTPSVGDDDLKVLGHTDDEWNTLGAADKWSKVQGFVQGQAQQAVVSKLQDYAAQANERNAVAKASQDTGNFLRAYAGPLPDGTSDTPENRLKTGLAALPPGADVGRVMPQAMTALSHFATIGAAAARQPVPYTSPSGNKFVTFGGQIAKDTAPQTVDDLPELPDGMQYVANGKGGFKAIHTTQPLSAKSVPVLDKFTGEPTGEMRTEVMGDPDAVEAWNQKINTARKASGTPEAAPAPVDLPGNKKDWKVGQVYNTNKGPLKWNGTQFVQ